MVYSSENILFLYLQNILAQLIQISERLHQLMDLSSKTFQLISINIFFYFCSYQSPIANAESPHKDLNQEHSYCYFYKHQYVILSLLCLFFFALSIYSIKMTLQRPNFLGRVQIRFFRLILIIWICPGNVLARVQRVQESADLWNINFGTC